MAERRASFFSRPDTVMRSHLTADELHLLNRNDPAVQWTSPSWVAIVLRHWLQHLLAVLLLGFGLLMLVVNPGSGRSGLIFLGFVFLVLAVTVVMLEARLFFSTYLRYIITPTRVIRMDGIIDRRSSSIEWSNITDISDHLGVLGQILDYGDIAIETANENSKFGELTDVPKPRAFLDAMNRARQGQVKTPLTETAFRALVAIEAMLANQAAAQATASTPTGSSFVSSAWGPPRPEDLR